MQTENLQASESLLPHPQVEQFFAQIDRICMHQELAADLFAELLACLVDAGIVAAATLWSCEQEQTKLLARCATPQFELPHPLPDALRQTPLGCTTSLAIAVPTPDEPKTGGPRLLVNYRCASHANLILAASLRAGVTAAVSRQRQEILEGFLELAGLRWLRQQFESLSQQTTNTEPSEAFLALVVNANSLTDATRDLAAEILSATAADRVSLLQVHAGQTRLLAMAPAGNIDQRSTVVRKLRAVVAPLANGRGSLSYCMGVSSTDAIPAAVLDYVDVSECRQLEIQLDSERLGEHPTAIVVERFTVDRTASPRDRALSEQTLPVLRYLVDRHERGWQRFLKPWRYASPARNAAVLGLAAAVCMIGLLLIPGEFWIPVDGHLQPVASQGVFAASDGVIESLHVTHGAAVQRGDTLLTIRDPQLELRISELDGQIATLQSQLASAQAARSQGPRDSQRNRSSELSAQEQDLEIQLAGLQRQRTVVAKHRQELTITSPMSGVVQRWDMQQELRDRPVTHGQHLLDVIDSDSRWQLRLDVPDPLIGYLLSSQTEQPSRVSFRIRSDPADVKSATVEKIAQSSQIDLQGRTTVLVVANVADGEIQDPRIGAGVVARIDCGRRSLAFIYFRELIEFCQRSFFF